MISQKSYIMDVQLGPKQTFENNSVYIQSALNFSVNAFFFFFVIHILD